MRSRSEIAAVLAVLALASLAGCDRATPPALSSVLRTQPDVARERIWSLTRDGVSVQIGARPGKTVIELPGWVWVRAQWACPPDLAVGPNGEAVVTSNVVPTLWKINPQTLAVSVHPLQLDTEMEIGFSQLAYSRAEGAFIAVSDTHGARWKIDAELATARKLGDKTLLANACRFDE